VTRYSAEQRQQLAAQSVGKVIAALDYDEQGDYYTYTFEDESEVSFRFMADLPTNP
jgi:hypothetical protein